MNELFTSVVWSLSQHAVGEKQSKVRQVAFLAHLTTLSVVLLLFIFTIESIKTTTRKHQTSHCLSPSQWKKMNEPLFFLQNLN